MLRFNNFLENKDILYSKLTNYEEACNILENSNADIISYINTIEIRLSDLEKEIDITNNNIYKYNYYISAISNEHFIDNIIISKTNNNNIDIKNVTYNISNNHKTIGNNIYNLLRIDDVFILKRFYLSKLKIQIEFTNNSLLNYENNKSDIKDNISNNLLNISYRCYIMKDKLFKYIQEQYIIDSNNIYYYGIYPIMKDNINNHIVIPNSIINSSFKIIKLTNYISDKYIKKLKKRHIYNDNILQTKNLHHEFYQYLNNNRCDIISYNWDIYLSIKNYKIYRDKYNNYYFDYVLDLDIGMFLSDFDVDVFDDRYETTIKYYFSTININNNYNYNYKSNNIIKKLKNNSVLISPHLNPKNKIVIRLEFKKKPKLNNFVKIICNCYLFNEKYKKIFNDTDIILTDYTCHYLGYNIFI